VWFAHRRLGIGFVHLLLPRPGDMGQWIRCVRR
jgi:hypothetical protein